MSLPVGFLTGLAASMGLGGGFVLIIYLTLFAGVPQLEAQGANLLFFLPVALFSVMLHARSRLIEWRVIPFAAAAGIAGALLGTLLGGFFGGELLQKLFAALLLPVSLRELFHRGRKKSGSSQIQQF